MNQSTALCNLQSIPVDVSVTNVTDITEGPRGCAMKQFGVIVTSSTLRVCTVILNSFLGSLRGAMCVVRYSSCRA